MSPARALEAEFDAKRFDSSAERRVQMRWRSAGIFERDPIPGRPKWFVVELPPFANGKLHLGHLRNYTIGDVIARFRRMAGYNVLYTVGFDAFGLPNENTARDEGCDPAALVERNIAEMLRQFARLGLSYDRRRIIADHEPRFYRWVQWIFLKLLAAGHAYRRSGLVNWCASCAATLAESLVENGRCWRCGMAVELREMERWSVREADFVTPVLAEGHRLPGWPETVKRIHYDWIGPRDGLEISFPLVDSDASITAFTTTPELLRETAFLAIGPLHPLAAGAAAGPVVALEVTAREPLRSRKLPIVLLRDDSRVREDEVAFGCPGRDPRDEAIWRSISRLPPDTCTAEVDTPPVVEALIASGAAQRATRYRLRDWDIARPRYWGTPVPVIHCSDCGPVPVPENSLPVLLPLRVDLGGVESPLARVPEFICAPCPRCGAAARRDTDTIETYVSPWWFYLTCKDPNIDSPFDRRSTDQWMPVDVLIGGADQIRTCFFHLRTLAEAMTRLGIVDQRYPVKDLIVIGMVKRDGRKMSKSAGNAVDVAELIDRHGADVLRLAVLSSAAPDQDINWDDALVTRASRFVAAVQRFFRRHDFDFDTAAMSIPTGNAAQRKLAQWVANAEHRVTGSIARYAFHVTIQQLTFLLERIEQYERERSGDDIAICCAARLFLKLLAPIAPHIAEHFWEQCNGPGLLAGESWPVAVADREARGTATPGPRGLQ